MKKIISLLLALLILFNLTACKNQEATPTTTEPIVNKPLEPAYENVSRPIKEFWLIDRSILALTESGELYCGPMDTPNPVHIIDNVKEVKMSEDYMQGLILLNDGGIIRINNSYESNDSISIIHEILYYGTIQNVENKILETSAKKLFNHYLYVSYNNELCNIKGEVLLQGDIKDGYIFSYSDGAGVAFSGVFLFADNTVKHYFTLHGDEKIREIANNVERLYCLYDGLYENTSFDSNRCCIIKENGDLLFWKLDEYSSEDTPLNPVNRIAQNANPDYGVYCTPYENSYIYYVNNHNLIKYSCETNSTETVYSNVKEVFYGNNSLDLQKISINHPAVLTMDNKLIRTDDDKIIAEDVIDILDNGNFIIYGDYSCGRFDGDSSYYHRLDNVKQAGCYGLQVNTQCQVFLKYGGALYASNDPYGTIYKTAFCEKNLTLYYKNNVITPKQSIQIKNNEPMLPYDECCEIFGLMSSYDSINNSVILESSETTIEFFIGQHKIKVNNTEITSSVASYTDSNGLIWIPIRYVAEAFQYAYNYDAEKFEIKIGSDTSVLLTEEEIKEKLKYACKLYDDWVGHGWKVNYDYEQEIVINGMPYYLVIPTEFATLDDLEAELQNHFAKDIYQEMFEHNYIEQDGQWYVVCTIGQGGNYGLNRLELDIVSNTSTECSFTVTSYYEETNDTDIFKYTMELIDDKWIFTEYTGTIGFFINENLDWI